MEGQGPYHHTIEIGNLLADAPKECCIYKVPQRFRMLDPDVYTPKVVSIGPFHHENPQLKKMENLKNIYCHNFINERSEASFDDLHKLVKELEPKIRDCYLENIVLNVEKFIEVILVDCCFILELLFLNLYSIQDDKEWCWEDIRWDLMLIENQIPFFVFQEICNLAFAPHLSNFNQDPFLVLSTNWYLGFEGTNVEELAPTGSVAHFTDLYRYYHLQPFSNLPEGGRKSLAQFYSTTELKEAGVKFRVNRESKCFLDLQFSWNCLRNSLRIPEFTVEDHTEMILRNMISFEQCHYPEESYFTDYVQLLVHLINTEKDVNILIDKGIIVNWLGDSKTVAKMFNSLGKNVGKNIVVGKSNSKYLHIYRELNAYCKHPWYSSMATLRREYCSTIASITASFLLILTITQTVCSILQVV